MLPYNLPHLQTELGILRPVLRDAGDSQALQLFDEFVREHEFGLALHVVCDYLIEPGRDPASTATVEKIRELHSAMKIEDECVEQLMKKQQMR